jgi:hypothetical protein
MTIHATWISQTQYWPADMLQQFADWISPGVLSMQDLQVTAKSPAAMGVNVSGAPQNQSGGNAWLPGGYRLYNDAQLSLNISAADPTNPRIDLVVCGIDTTTTPYTPTIKVIQGTPAASPSIPAVPSGYITLAQVTVPANATSISSSNITDKRVLAGFQGDGSRLNNLPIPTDTAKTDQSNTFLANQSLGPTAAATASQNFGSFLLSLQRSVWSGGTAQTKTNSLQLDNTGKLNFINETGTSVWNIDQSGNVSPSGNIYGVGQSMWLDTAMNVNTASSIANGSAWKVKGKNGNTDLSVAVDGTHKVQTFNNTIDDGIGNATFNGNIKVTGDSDLAQYNISATNPDSNGKYTVVTYTRPGGNKYMVSTLSGTPDANGNYPTMTNVFYKADGVTIDHTDTWTLTYDANGVRTGATVVRN